MRPVKFESAPTITNTKMICENHKAMEGNETGNQDLKALNVFV